ncbi:A deaminase domain containing protein [Asbolus verrucosus]|uniref:Adenosine deaminase n=1 Tax=Asbolus verrucosus TaxID=1661398 RepID=A0A482VLZ0_ASBVE|nr:A deaminase domain containing protein [Asbolus verrucosus]
MVQLVDLFLVILLIFGHSYADYRSDREAILAQEASELIGSSIELTEKEQQVNDLLMELKFEEYDQGFNDPSKFLPSIHFFRSKAEIEKSEVFKFIKMMPKGASLHSHLSAMVSFDFLFNLTYYENLYGCDDNGTFKLHFFFDSVNDDCNWKLLSDWRSEDANFDDFLKSQLTLVVDNPETTYDNINAVWNKFEKIFGLVSPLLDYKPVLHDYIYRILQEFHDDNVMYLEIRTSFGETFDSSGTIYDAFDTVNLYVDTLTEFRTHNPDFGGLRIIYSRNRRVNNVTMQEYIEEYLKFQEQFPELIAGFDLVGQEDLGEPLFEFADQFLAIANQTKFFFHAGETNWNGASTDLNLIDAVLLNSSRIGHGFALSKHFDVLRKIKDQQIAIELNPISNQVLKLVDDLRNHVGTSLIAGGYPVVIACDDPSFWGAKGLSYDWYLAFMGMTPRSGDLKILKQLALNSLTYSSLEPDAKASAVMFFEGKWDEFLNTILKQY